MVLYAESGTDVHEYECACTGDGGLIYTITGVDVCRNAGVGVYCYRSCMRIQVNLFVILKTGLVLL